MKNYNGSEKISDIISRSPDAAKVFIRKGIDFFNCEDITLQESIMEKGIGLEEIIKDLEESFNDSNHNMENGLDWRNVKNSEIINHIIKYHHTFLKNELPATELLLAKILKVHYDDSGKVLTKAYRLFNQLKTEFEIILTKERRYLFPLILEYERFPSKELLDKILKEIKETDEERNFLGYILKELRGVTNNYTLPASSCQTYEKTYRKLLDIELNILYYLHLENNIIFRGFTK